MQMGNRVGNKTESAMEGIGFAEIFFLTALTGWWDRAFVDVLNSSSLILLVLFCCVISMIKSDISNNNNK